MCQDQRLLVGSGPVVGGQRYLLAPCLSFGGEIDLLPCSEVLHHQQRVDSAPEVAKLTESGQFSSWVPANHTAGLIDAVSFRGSRGQILPGR